MIILDGNCNDAGVAPGVVRGTTSAGARGKAGSRRGGLAVRKLREGQAVLCVGIVIWGGDPNSETDRFLVTSTWTAS